ncbi:MAG: gliding motility-associated C-terminal domain-containing protein [Bacteroidetes bacterium]|nr:gliding motility-associated C-terminal domain-containing protein [Bacteroidota bacterium]
MKQILRSVILFVMFLPGIAFGQTHNNSLNDCPGIPGACGYHPSDNTAVQHSIPNVNPQNGNGTMGNIFSLTKCGLNYATASQRLGKRFTPAGINQPAPFVISGIPACGVIEKAYLWAEGSGNGAAQTATIVNPALVSTNYPMAIVGQGPDKCWGYAGSYTYRADVTSCISGNGTYNISGILTNPPTSGNDMDGATLIVIWSDASQAWQGTINIADGAIVVNGGNASWNMTFPAICGTPTNGNGFFGIGDIQFNPNSWSINGTACALTWNWWNIISTATTYAVGQTSANFSVSSSGDCYNLCIACTYWRTTCVACTSASITLTTSAVGATCSACNGSATVTATPAGAYTYSWSPSGGTGSTATALCAGTYTVTVTGTCGSQTATVVVPTVGGTLTLSGAQTNVTCFGSCNGSATVTVTSGTGPFTYAWSPSGGTGSSATGLCAGTYTCTVTGAGGCTGTQTFNITQPPAITDVPSQVNVTCFGTCNGSATVVAAGGTGTYTYSWAPVGGTAATASALCAGSYTCTISSPAGCTHTQTFTITQPPVITATPSQVNVTCNGSCNGSATVVAAGGTGTYTYSWAPVGGTAATASALCAGNYTCTISSPAGCTITQTFNITQPPAITATNSQVNITCNGSCTGSASVVASGGTGTYTYAWTPSGGTAATASALCAGNYTCTISSPAGCTITQSFSITQPPAITATQSQTNVTCNGGCNGTATVVAAGGNGTYTYAWAPSGGTSATASGLCAGTYTCTISSPAGCSITKTFTITQPTAVGATTSFVGATCGNSNGSVTATGNGGTGPYTYSWNSTPVQNTSTATGLPSGTYTCTITDANLCTFTVAVTIPNAGSPTATITAFTNVTCFGSCNGTATGSASGGTSPYTYSWSPTGGTGTNAVGLCPATYTFTVTDANGCLNAATVTITQPPVITSTGSQVNVSCNAACNGSATVVASGGTGTYTYSWSPSGGTGATASALCAGNYTVTINSPAGCSVTQSFAITQPAALAITPSQTNVTCNAACNGSATVTVTGGTPPYSYGWAPSGGTGSSATGLCANNYTCTVTDANGCILTQTFNITQPTALTATSSFIQSTCGNPNGSATATASGGTPIYSYSWNTTPVQTTATASNILAGTYTCTITDANLCTFTISVTVPNAGSPTATLSAFTNVTCNGACNGTADVTVAGGTLPYTYNWTPAGGNAANATALCPATYTCTVTDANGCQSTATVTITEPPALTISGTQVDVNCNAACNGSATVTVGGGVTPYSYNWTPSGGSAATAASLCAGTYTCTVTDANGCIITQTFTITEPTALTLAAAGFNVTCFNACDGQIVVIPSGGTPVYTFLWSTGCNQPSCSNICAGTYNITVTDNNGCTATGTATVTQPTAVVATATEVDAHCNQFDGSVTASGSGGTGTLNYQWTGGPATATWNGVQPGSYTCTVTDANNCTGTVIITVNNIPGVVSNFVSSANVSCNGACDGTITCSTTGGTGVPTYAWTPSGGTGLTASALCNGTYTFTATDAAGCTDTTVTTITQPTPLVVTASVNPPAVCAGQSVTLTGGASGGTPGYTYNWVPLGQSGSSQTYVPVATGPQTVLVQDAHGCIDSASVNITVNANPVATLAGDSLTGCVPHCVNFSDLSTLANGTITGWSWDFGDGVTSTSQNPSHCYITAGTYSVTLTVTTSTGCTNTIVMPNYITIYPLPVADFTASPQPTTELDPTIYFLDASIGANTWSWTFGDTTSASSTLQNPSFMYGGSGCFNVVLTVSSVNGCVDTTVHPICIDPDVTLFVPNAFTPNGDGINETFFAQGIGIDPDKFEMWIFDRWGNLIFYTDDMNKGWNGKVQGHEDLCQIDTYVWKIKAIDVMGHKHSLIGKVSLIR